MLFQTTVAVDGVDHVVKVLDGDSPVAVARNFAITHKLDLEGAKSVLMHLKQRALVGGHMKRVFFALPVLADKANTKQVKCPGPFTEFRALLVHTRMAGAEPNYL